VARGWHGSHGWCNPLRLVTGIAPVVDVPPKAGPGGFNWEQRCHIFLSAATFAYPVFALKWLDKPTKLRATQHFCGN